MSAVNITNVTVLDNPAPFSSPFQFEISYECVAPLKDGTPTFTRFLQEAYVYDLVLMCLII
ncbi:hypothetical protein Patl1_21393 [Pistacia atlantica]|uniref:Uncharacterized protein n=1 Tax=Pistacia atlantica TaxID=434234 RepID=A0ACC1BKC5_9ROSI|nr:hypothetical protein Patl1_21393 [Pistacia atlantica]